MIGKVLQSRNLTKACRQVVSNKGSAGIDGMKTEVLKTFIDNNRSAIALDILHRKYILTAIKGTVRRRGRNSQIKRENQITRSANGGRSLASTSGKPTIGEQIRVRIRR